MSDWIKKLKVNRLKAKNAKIYKLEACDATIKNVSATQITSNSVNTKNVTSENLNVTDTANVKNLNSTNGQIGNLQVVNLNGRNLACQEQTPTFNNTNSQLITVDPLVYPPNSGFSKIVWDNLVTQTLRQRDELAARLQCGRLQVKYIQDEFGCVQCPPNELQNCTPFCDPPAPPGEVCGCPQESGICPSVPLNIFGIQSFLPVRKLVCNANLFEYVTQLLSSVSYNLDVVNVTGTLAERVVTILVQTGHLDGNGDFVYNEIDFGNRQFTATLDTAYGEKYTGTIALDTDFIKEISSSPNTGAMVQLVVFAEDGVDIDIKNKVRGKARQTAAPNGAVDATVVTTPPPSNLLDAGITQRYSYQVDAIFRLSSTLKIIKPGRNTSFYLEGTFAPDDKVLFGIQSKEPGVYSILATIRSAINVVVGASYITSENIPSIDGTITYLSLYTDSNSIPFPNFFAPDSTYEIEITRGNIIPVPTADWTFTIRNQTTGDTINMGTVTTNRDNNFLRGSGIATSSSYFGPGIPTFTCDNYPGSVVTWTFPQANSDQTTLGEAVPDGCGASNVQIDSDARTATISLGCQSCPP